MVAQENLQLLAVLRQVYKELQECKQAVADLSEHVQTYGGGNVQIVVQGEASEEESEYEPSDMSDQEEDVQSCPF